MEIDKAAEPIGMNPVWRGNAEGIVVPNLQASHLGALIVTILLQAVSYRARERVGAHATRPIWRASCAKRIDDAEIVSVVDWI